ncbi:MAG: helix-turn-helix domain-containing protein [Ilumatobacteraceae bacterium]
MTSPIPNLDQVRAMLQPLMSATGAELIAAETAQAGDITLRLGDAVVGAVRLPALHGALDRVIDSVERELGGKLNELSRDRKQLAIRMLDERGAFTLRRAVEDIADAMGVSRITVYNYLNALHR